MLLTKQLIHYRSVDPGPLVLGIRPRISLPPIVDRGQTVSRRSKPSSGAFLTREQLDPWERLHPQDKTSRHRGAKPHRR
jgi:hypothetical protein